MKELNPEMMSEILGLAKKLPKGSKMEIEIPEKGAKGKGKMCPECGKPMDDDKEEKSETKTLREKLEG